MADAGQCVITLRKEVPDETTARLLLDVIKQRMADRPDVTVTGHFTSRFDLDEEPPT